jgi:hypothetical protein
LKCPADCGNLDQQIVAGMNGDIAATSQSALLHNLRVGLLHLHHALLNMERKSFETTHRRVNSGDLLQLVLNHAQFAWLRIISALVVQIDEMLDADEQASAADMISLIASARQLFTASDDKEFSDKYQAALQQEPDVVLAHAGLMKLLRPKG